ncbi:MAG: hypothetical protein PHD74_04945 [Candidatus Krumholzibacteria bacterium]|nr:hypothetical protein [Candidatus Krumholzibacteria bacterium]
MKKILSVVVFLFAAFSCSPVLGQEQFPSWVPPEAVQAAKERWLHMMGLKTDARLFEQYGIWPEDLPRSQLKDPRKIIGIDYESYQPDSSDIFTMLNDRNGKYANAFGFSVFIDEKCVGTIVVSLRDQQWVQREITGANKDVEDVYARIYSSYPPSDDLIIYETMDAAFFVVMDDKVIDTFHWNVETMAFEEMNPAQYMMKEKARILEFKKSAYYQHILEIKKQQHADSLR